MQKSGIAQTEAEECVEQHHNLVKEIAVFYASQKGSGQKGSAIVPCHRGCQLASWHCIFQDETEGVDDHELIGQIRSSKTGVDFLVAEEPIRTIHVHFPASSRTLPFQIEQDLRGLGLGACVWDCAIWLGRFIAANEGLVKGKSVVELGCGTGLAGLCAWAAGAARATLTDRPALGPLARANLRRAAAAAAAGAAGAGLPPLPPPPGEAEFESYAWGDSPGWSLPAGGGGGGYEVALCADCLYEAGAAAALARALRATLRPGGLLLVAHKRRLPRQEAALFGELLRPTGGGGGGGGVDRLWVVRPAVVDGRGAPRRVDSLFILVGLWRGCGTSSCDVDGQEEGKEENNNSMSGVDDDGPHHHHIIKEEGEEDEVEEDAEGEEEKQVLGGNGVVNDFKNHLEKTLRPVVFLC